MPKSRKTKGAMRVSVQNGKIIYRSDYLSKEQASQLARRIEALEQYNEILINQLRGGQVYVTCVPNTPNGWKKMLERHREPAVVRAYEEGDKYRIRRTKDGFSCYNPLSDMTYQLRVEPEGYYSCTCPQWQMRCRQSGQPCKHICELESRTRGIEEE